MNIILDLPSEEPSIERVLGGARLLRFLHLSKGPALN